MVFRASLFSTFGAAKRWLGTDHQTGLPKPLTTADFYKAGAITGFVAAFSEGPIDFYKSQIQVQIVRAKTDAAYKPPYTTVGACVKATLRENGLRGPFQGLGATILRNTPANSVYLGSFEVMKRAACEKLGVSSPADLPAWAVLGSAGLGGIMYWTVIFPVDCVKSAMQTDTIVRSQRKYRSMLQTAGELWREGGVKRFYRGFAPCLIRAAPANASMLFTVEVMHNLMAGVGEEDK
jgi:solute carrier family 25 carnitine/acylcarnitine transporter 20/29